MMNRLAPALALAAAVLTGTHAAALSCVRPDPARAFAEAAASTETYAVLYGAFDFDPDTMPVFDGVTAPETIPPVAARFSGRALSAEGFTIPYDTELWLQPTCAGPWCGAMEPASDILAFVRDRGDGTYQLDLGPCAQWIFPEPGPDVLALMAACMAGRADCSAAP